MVEMPKICEGCIYNGGRGCTLTRGSENDCARIYLLDELEAQADEEYYKEDY